LSSHEPPAFTDAAAAAAQGTIDPGDQQRLRAAWIYYVEGRTQNEVAGILGINRVAVTRILSEARRRGEVRIQITAPLAEVVALERALEARHGLARAHVAPFADPEGDPTRVIAAVAGQVISELMDSAMTVGVGWGRTLHATLPFIVGRSLRDVRVISMLGGIAQARRFNPAEFAWQFAERFDGEGFLVPAPALVDSPQTKHALLEHCGLAQVFELAQAMDAAIFSAGGISTLTTSYRVGHVSEADRRSLMAAGAVGDVLYHFIDESGEPVDHPVNDRAISVALDTLARVPVKVLVSGGPEKLAVLRGALRKLAPTTLVTDEQTARRLLA